MGVRRFGALVWFGAGQDEPEEDRQQQKPQEGQPHGRGERPYPRGFLNVELPVGHAGIVTRGYFFRPGRPKAAERATSSPADCACFSSSSESDVHKTVTIMMRAPT